MDEYKQIKVRRGNVILSVPEYDKDNYLAKGFDVLGDNGKVVEASMPNDVPTLQKKLVELTQENKALKEQLAKKSTPTPKKAPEQASEALGTVSKSSSKKKKAE